MQCPGLVPVPTAPWPVVVTVQHGFYGCDCFSPCCGWSVYPGLPDEDGLLDDRLDFNFGHPPDGLAELPGDPDEATSAALVAWSRKTFGIPDHVEVRLGKWIRCA